MSGPTSQSYAPSICRCEHFKHVHSVDGSCEAEFCLCVMFDEIPLDESDFGREMNRFLRGEAHTSPADRGQVNEESR